MGKRGHRKRSGFAPSGTCETKPIYARMAKGEAPGQSCDIASMSRFGKQGQKAIVSSQYPVSGGTKPIGCGRAGKTIPKTRGPEAATRQAGRCAKQSQFR